MRQVKTIFKLFQVDDTAFKSYYWQHIFPLLQRLWHGRDGRPNDYFEMDGYNSGLLLPALKLPSGGYSIATWVCVSSFTSNYHRESYQPYLFSFLTEDATSGIEAHFNRGKLVLRTNPQHGNTSKREMRIVNYDFMENKWYFIALTHTKKLILSDECHVYVNGESVQHFNLKYPKNDHQTLNAARLGTAGTIPEPRACMRGKMAGFLAFDDTLNADEVRALYQSGANLFSSLQPLQRLVLMPRSRLARRPDVLFFYTPRATDCSVCLEPWSNDASRRANMLPGVRSCITTGFQDALSSVGGIQLLLPLFSSQYRPSSGENIDVNTKVLSLLIELVTDNEFALTEMLRARFFQIMGYLLATDFNQSVATSSTSNPSSSIPGSASTNASNQSGSSSHPSNASSSSSNTSHQSDFVFNHTNIDTQHHAASHTGAEKGEKNSASNAGPGASSSGPTKGKASSNKWSPQSIEVLDKLANAVAGFRATNASLSNGPLFEQMIRHVYLNFRIWTNADYEVQLALLRSIQAFAKNDPELLHSFFSVSQMMLILNEHFTYAANPINSDGSESDGSSNSNDSIVRRTSSMLIATNSTGNTHFSKVDWTKRPRTQLVELRKALLGTLHSFIQVGITVKEMKSIVNYLHHEVATKPEERRLITDVLQVLLICIGEKHSSLMHHINTLGNLLIFLPLMKAENERFRVWTLKVIGKLLQNADLESEQRMSIIEHLPSIRKVLEPYPLSHHTYNVLLEILIDSVSADGLINPVDFALHPSTPTGAAHTSLKNLKMISVIFQLLNVRSEMDLRVKVLKDFLFYLKRGTENRTKFVSQHDWQAWILSLLVPETPTSASSASPSSSTSSSANKSARGGKDEKNSGLKNAPSSGLTSQQSQNNNASNSHSGHSRSKSGGASLTRRLQSSRGNGPAPPLLLASNAASNTSLLNGNAVDNAAYAVLTGLATEIFALIFETALLSGCGLTSAVFEGTSAVLRRMASIRGFDAIAIANAINTKVLKVLAENNIVARCKASPLTLQMCVQYLAFVESTFFRTPGAPISLQFSASSGVSATGSPAVNRSREHLTSSSDSNLSSDSSSTPIVVGPGNRSSGAFTTNASGSITLSSSSQSLSSSPQIPLDLTAPLPIPAEKDSLKYGDKPLLPLWLHYAPNGQWVSFTLAQRILDLVDQLVMNKVERTPNMEISSEMLDRLEAALSRFRTRLILYSIAEGATFKSTNRLRLRKESIRNIRQVIYDGFTSASSKSLASQSSEMPSGGVHASLARYLSKKAKQWDTEMSDVDAMFHRNIKRIRALFESTPSTHAALYILAYIGALVQKANAPSSHSAASSVVPSMPMSPQPVHHHQQHTPSTPSHVSVPVASQTIAISQTPPPAASSNFVNTGSSSKNSSDVLNSIFGGPAASNNPVFGNQTSSSAPLSTTPTAIPSHLQLLQQAHGQGSSSSLIASPARGGAEGGANSPILTSSPSVGQTSTNQNDESVQLTLELWKDAIGNIKNRLSSDGNYGATISRLEGEVLLSFFETGFSSPREFMLTPAIEKAIDYIVANDLNAMNATQNAMKVVSERYTDLTQAESMQELEQHKIYEQEWQTIASADVAAMKEASTVYAIRHSQYVSIIANTWKNLLRVLHDTRGPWSSPYSALGEDYLANPDLHTAAAATAGLQMASNVAAAKLGGVKMYWKLDSTENAQRMRLKLKRHYGDVSVLENASAKNCEKEKLFLESLSSSGGGPSSSPLSPNASHSSLPPFDATSSSSTSAGTSNTNSQSQTSSSGTLNRAELLKLVAKRGNDAAPLDDDDDNALIDTELGIGENEDGSHRLASSGMVSSSSSTSVSGATGTGTNAGSGSAAAPANTTSSNSGGGSASIAASKGEERTLLVTTCEYVKGITSTAGDFEITTQNIYFRNLEQGVFKMIPIEKLKSIYSRRYLLRNTALEMFTTRHTSHFFTFDRESPHKVLKVIVDKARPPNLREYFAGSSAALARKKKHITEAWKKRQISNFEYLMELNTIAGRSYNDLSQYPVFPWVICDYESEKIDLNNPAIYRDLSKPIGALDPSRLEKFMLRYEEMVKNYRQAQEGEDEDQNSNSMSLATPPFMYGSHYSSHSIVLFYLLRLEPFTTQSLELQGGSFDLPQRLFTSIPETWKNCLINQSDVKELIPEFFFLPSFLHDTNDVNVGFLKNSSPGAASPLTSIDTVTLPPWASSPQAFIQMNRMALESEHVSAHLNEWIDLVFGFKQLGQEAIDANNVFYYTSYEGNIDIDSIADATLKQSVQMQIREFGQTPSRLFTAPHPTRLTLEEIQKAKRNALASLVATALTGGSGAEQEWKPTTADLGKTIALTLRPNTVVYSDLISINVDSKNERFILVFMDGLVQTVNFKIPRGKRFPLTLSPQWNESEIINNAQKKEEHSLENSPSAPGLDPGQYCFAYLDSFKVLVNCGSWDRSISLSLVSSGLTMLQSVQEHTDVVTCLAISQDSQTLISASRDCNVLVWDLEDFILKKRSEKDAVAPKPKFVLFGHDDAINAVAVNSDLSMIVTASQDCTSIVYDLVKGRYVRTIPHDTPVTLVAISKFGDIVTYCSAGEILRLHSVNGTLLQRLTGVGKLTALKFSIDGQLLVTSGQNSISVRSLFQYSLKRIYLWKCPTAVSAIELFHQDEYLLIGLCDGTLLTVLFDMNKLLTDMSREMAMEKTD